MALNMSPSKSYETSLLPMTPIGNDAIFDPNGVPYIGCDFRTLINIEAYNGISDNGDGQWTSKYSFEDLQDDFHGLGLKMFGDREKELKELQAYKDLLDHVKFNISMGEMTEEDLKSTQDTIHAALKDGHNRYYRWFDLRKFPINFIREQSTGLTGDNSLCNNLRKNFRVWYVSFQEDRVVVMGNDYIALGKCMEELRNKLQVLAAGDWVDLSYGTTQRWERIQTRVDLELSNIDLIAETWKTTTEEAYEYLKSESEIELDIENELRIFALTGYFPSDTIDPLL